MLSKPALAWSVTALVFVTAMALGGALYRAKQTLDMQEKTIRYLRDTHAKSTSYDASQEQKLREEIARLERELTAAQNAQRDLTEELFTSEEDIGFLLDELKEAEKPIIQRDIAPSPYPAYLALRKAVLSGNPFGTELKAMIAQFPNVTGETFNTLKKYQDGVATSETLKQTLREIHAHTQNVETTHSILSRLSGVLSIRKIDTKAVALDKAVTAGDLNAAAQLVHDDDDYNEWREAYEARRDVVKALHILAENMAGAHG